MSTRSTRASRTAQAASTSRQDRTRPARRPSSLKRKLKTAFALFTLLVITPLAFAVVYFLVVFMQVSKTLPSVNEIGNIRTTHPTEIYFSDGSLMAVLLTENRQPKKLSEISQSLIDATIATEDSRFYEHKGVDMHGIARAIYKNAAGGEMREGASTITQQLARNVNELGLGREKKLRRKVAEAILAMRMEQTFSKNEILELYLNQIYYGNGAYGAEAAAKTYFHKSAKDLKPGEAAMLAGLPQSPSRYSRDIKEAYKRRDQVLLRMVETGKITAQEKDKIKATPLKMATKFERRGTRIYGAPYVVNYVMQQLEKEFGGDVIYDGWKIYTTIHPQIQQAAEQTLKAGIHEYASQANQAALVSMDPKTGYIRAMVGGLDFKRSQYNVVTQGLRQPGSCFKPIVYTAGIDTDTCTLNKWYPDDGHFTGERDGRNGWHPKNYGGKKFASGATVKTAIKWSINTIAVKVATETGLDTVMNYARRMGINTIDPVRDRYPPLALGSASVRPLELCDAYCVFANGGKRPVPLIITKVIDANGDTVKTGTPELVETGIRPEALEQVNEGMREVVAHGTGTAAAAVPDARGKTGTTSDNRDAWFSGFTPDLVTIIWAAEEQHDKKGRVQYLPMEGTTGGHLCAPTWRDFMLKAVPIQQEALRAASPPPPAAPQPATPTLEEKAKKEKKTPLPGEANPAGPNAGPNANGVNGNGTPGAVQVPSGNPINSAPPPANGVQPPGTLDSRPDVRPAPISPGGTNTPPAGQTSTPSVNAIGTQRSTRMDRNETISRMSEPTGRIAAPPVRRADPGDDMITVRICAESGQSANGPWCPSTTERRMRRRDVPRRCRLHRAPPGEG